MNKIVKNGKEARQALLKGIDLLANTVKVTLGPKGRLVIIGHRVMNETPTATKDGVTVANHVSCKEPLEQMGCDMIREAAQKTVQHTGDGTTTSTLLAQVLIHSGIQHVDNGIAPDELNTGMKCGLSQVLTALEIMALPADEKMLEQVAIISSNGDHEIGKLVLDAVNRVGKDGIICCESARSMDTSLDVTMGMQLPQGFCSPYFINSMERSECTMDSPIILMYEGRLGSYKALIPALKLSRGMGRPLLVIAGDYEPEPLAFLVQNKIEEGFKCCAIRADGWGERRREILSDIAIMTGGIAVTEDLQLNLENLTADYFGKCSRVTVTEEKTLIIGGSGDKAAIEVRAGEIKNRIEATEDATKALLLTKRLSGLTGGVAVIRVGGATDSQIKEKKDRVEDAMYAARAAIDAGVVAGGGLALLMASKAVQGPESATDGIKAGIGMVVSACSSPLNQIVSNSGKSGEAVLAKVNDYLADGKQIGYNAATGEYQYLFKVGIIDPLRVVKEALINAVSVAGIVLSTEAVIAEDFGPEVKE